MLAVRVCVSLSADDGGWGWGKTREVDKRGPIIAFNVPSSSAEPLSHRGPNLSRLCWPLGASEPPTAEIQQCHLPTLPRERMLSPLTGKSGQSEALMQGRPLDAAQPVALLRHMSQEGKLALAFKGCRTLLTPCFGILK